jgi:hypothetical protein
MSKPLNLKKIVKNNPKIDIELLSEALRLSKQLQTIGSGRAPRVMVPPYARKRAAIRFASWG